MHSHHHTADASSCMLQAVSLALSCLSYDFIGTCTDESSEDLGTIQVLPCPCHTELVIIGVCLNPSSAAGSARPTRLPVGLCTRHGLHVDHRKDCVQR